MIDFDQQQRIHIGKVMKYIEQNLDQKLSLEQLAKVSSYSQFHFHRIFTGLIGETPSDYVKRIRMEKAAHFLIYEPGMTVTEIALTCGFSSLSYFTASFTLCSQRFYEKIFNDYSYRDIAKELQVNPKIIKDYFISEGLIKG